MERSEKVPKWFSKNALKLLSLRFAKRKDNGEVLEKPREIFERVAEAIALSDRFYGSSIEKITILKRKFFKLMWNLYFLPNSPTLLNGGRERAGSLSACFVFKVGDSLNEIFTTLKNAVITHQSGGGTGFDFSAIRPRGDCVGGVKGVAAGPVHYIRTFSVALERIKQGGIRGGGNMAVLRVDHPDIEEFIDIKSKNNGILSNFNCSVAVTDDFMRAVLNNEKFNLVNPRNGEITKKVYARKIFDKIVSNAWVCGEPGMLFLDTINRDNPTPHIGKITATNPCGEQPLLPNESCNLGSINLMRHFDWQDNDLDWDLLRKTVRLAVHFLDNVVDANVYPLPEIESITRFGNRKIGLGIMGWADVLVAKGIRYDSEESLKYAKKVMSFIQKEAHATSSLLAKRRGPFPNYRGSMWEKRGLLMRNATVTTIAPTGHISILADTTGGIEPVYSYISTTVGYDPIKESKFVLTRLNKAFQVVAKREHFLTEKVINQLKSGKSPSEIAEIPSKWRNIFVTSHEISPYFHVKIQSVFQKYVDNSISKTVNIPADAKKETVADIYILAWKLGCKGVTVFRENKDEKEQPVQKGFVVGNGFYS